MRKEYKGLVAEKIILTETMHSSGYTGKQSGCQSIIAFTSANIGSTSYNQCWEAAANYGIAEGTPVDESWAELFVTPMPREYW